jgi:xylulokinase
MGRCVLAIDLGSSGVKVAVVDPEGVVRGGAGEGLPTLLVAGDGAEQDPAVWWEAIGRCSRRALQTSGTAAADIGLVAVTSQYTSTVAVDAAGLPVANAVMWMDGRSGAYHPFGSRPADERGALLECWVERHGMPAGPGDVLGQMAFIRTCWPDAWSQAAALVQPVDHLLARITGVLAANQNTAFPLLLVDNRVWNTAEYSDELLARSGADASRLPALQPFGVPRGAVTADAAVHLGITTAAVAMGGAIDTTTSAVGTGAIDDHSRAVMIGTTAVVLAHVAGKREDLAHAITSAPSPVPGRYALIAENGAGGKALDVFVNNVVYPGDGLAGQRPDDAFERVIAAAATVPPGANGVLFLPWLVGSMAPEFDRHQRGAFLGLGLGSNRADMARAVLEGVALNLARLVPHVTAVAGCGDVPIRFGGGGAASSLWGQILAAATGSTVHRRADPGFTNCRGAALVALAESGAVDWADIPALVQVAEVHEPDPVAVQRYAPLVAAFDDFQHLTSPFFRQLHRTLRQQPAPTPSPTPQEATP